MENPHEKLRMLVTDLDSEVVERVVEMIPEICEIDHSYDSGGLVRYAGVDTYFLTQRRTYEHDGESYRRDTVDCIDMDISGSALGLAVIGNGPITETSENIPYIGFTKTFPEYRRQGLGRRRLLVANSISIHLFNEPLRSDLNEPLGSGPNEPGGTSPEAASLWNRLVLDGLAEKVTPVKGRAHWRFK